MDLSVPLLSGDHRANRDVDDLVAHLSPSLPVHILDTRRLAATAAEFTSQFRGTVMYAVKCNPTKDVIRTLAKSGIKTFDAASIEEVRLIRRLVPSAKIHFMHTVKSREAIREAYFTHGVRVFVCDCQDELHKILAETDLAPDLHLFIRLALPKNTQAAYDFSVKFGAIPQLAVTLLREARLVAQYVGVMFHVGSQSTSVDAFRRGILTAANVINESGVSVDSLDVGGGFPVAYPSQTVPPLTEFMTTIHQAIDDYGLSHLQLFCEPGRALVAESGKLIVRIELRKDNALYINDGVYGGLVEAAAFQGGFIFPTRLIRAPDHPCLPTSPAQTSPAQAFPAQAPFRFCGPTCDSVDMMNGPFLLPADSAAGDWIEISQTGAYSIACRTNFNGFGKSQMLVLPRSSATGLAPAHKMP